ncbi:MAG TPA: 16S rRNA (cytidine(1402)-2'-O)-methyltransferase [Patescibacteria group bacterium]|nr:16S rRNA (cytidine(1402)-2'-O)-methyltransferase [Patescibacteria group bacterium]
MLYVVATPIGNLKDITLRALEALKEVDFILCEDTRVTRNLLNHYEINKKMISYHHHTDEKKMAEIVELIRNNKVALVTDAGTPGINDPGGILIKALKQEYKNIKIQEYKNKDEEDIRVVPIPGPCAAIAALSVSGFPTDEFLFKGFVPHKKGRQTFLKEVLGAEMTVVFYESCHRIIKCLEEIKTLMSADKNTDERGYREKELVIGRELTKKFETIYRGKIQEVLERVKSDPVKGEYVIIIH